LFMAMDLLCSLPLSSWSGIFFFIVSSRIMVCWSDQDHALISKLSLFSFGTAGLNSRDALIKLIRKEFEDTEWKWISPLHYLSDTHFHSRQA
jgi:hypothetical protein